MRKKWFTSLYIACALLFGIFLLNSCSSGDDKKKDGAIKDNLIEEISCDLEKTSDDNKSFVTSGKHMIDGVACWNTEKAKSGSHSVKVFDNQQYALTMVFEEVHRGEYFRVSVWRNGQDSIGRIVASDETAKIFFRDNEVGSSVKENDWQLLSLDFVIPPDMDGKKLKIFVWNPDKKSVYFDDLKIEYMKEKEYPVYSIPALQFEISDSCMDILKKKRDDAFKRGVLVSDEDSWVKAKMKYGDEKYKVLLRLKGDWLDHLEGRKWSFRVKIRKEEAWNQIKAFSIQNPTSRFFLFEYLLHKMMREEGLLTTRYGFVPVVINGVSVGIYSWEEHFDKQLVESASRREGPILKFDEDQFWTVQAYSKEHPEIKEMPEVPAVEASVAVPFKADRTLSAENLYENFVTGSNLMFAYKYGLRSASELFDVDKLARYYAIVNITRGYHGFQWHNLRFYVNPVIQKLEPILFDCYGDYGVYDWQKAPIFGDFNKRWLQRAEMIHFNLFRDKKFVDLYIKYLEEYSNEDFVNKFLSDNKRDIDSLTSLIREEYPLYTYNEKFLKEKSEMIRMALPAYRERVETPGYILTIDSIEADIPYSYTYDLPFEELFVNAYLNPVDTSNAVLWVENLHCRSIKPIGTGTIEEAAENLLDNQKPIQGYTTYSMTTYHKIGVVSNTASWFFFKEEGKDKVFRVPVNPWPKPENESPRFNYEANSGMNFNFIAVKGNEVTFKQGKHKINKNILIPEGYTVYMKEGTELDLVNSATFMCYSPLNFTGTVDKPIKIISSDKSANGFVVLQASGRSTLENVIFDGFNTLNYKGWTLTGAVNFYESDVTLKNVQFINNVCEDALNIIRSDFVTENCVFRNTFGDAFDSDFSTGKVINCTFQGIANDAIDFSGSTVLIEGCTIDSIGDKGVSGGEESFLTVKDCKISRVCAGISAKDLSSLKVENLDLKDAAIGFTLYRKKPEYGPSVMDVKGYNFTGVADTSIIEKKSVLTLDGKIFKGDAKNVYQYLEEMVLTK